ncbi:MAG: hypothetical protein ABIF82_06150 [Planctomycetota bacterium]
MSSVGSKLLSFLRQRELLPVPNEGVLLQRWNASGLRKVLDLYVALHGEALPELVRDAQQPESEFWVYLDLPSLAVPSFVARHLLLAQRVIAPDPLTMLAPVPEDLHGWVKGFHGALSTIAANAMWLRADFLTLVLGPRYCGIHESAAERTAKILDDEKELRPWLQHGAVQVPNQPAIITADEQVFDVPTTAYHWGGQFRFAQMNAAKELDEKLTAGEFASFRLDNADFGPKTPSVYTGFEKAIKDPKWRNSVTQIVGDAILVYTSKLAMASLWTGDRLTSADSLTNQMLVVESGREAETIRQQSSWLAPAMLALEILQIQSDSADRVLQFRAKHSGPFARSVHLVRDVAKALQELPPSSNFAQDARSIVEAELVRPMKDIERELDAARVGLKLKVPTTFVISALAGTALLLTQPFSWVSATTAAIPAAASGAIALAHGLIEKLKVKRNPLYFLWRAKKDLSG